MCSNLPYLYQRQSTSGRSRSVKGTPDSEGILLLEGIDDFRLFLRDTCRRPGMEQTSVFSTVPDLLLHRPGFYSPIPVLSVILGKGKLALPGILPVSRFTREDSQSEPGRRSSTTSNTPDRPS